LAKKLLLRIALKFLSFTKLLFKTNKMNITSEFLQVPANPKGLFHQVQIISLRWKISEQSLRLMFMQDHHLN